MPHRATMPVSPRPSAPAAQSWYCLLLLLPLVSLVTACGGDTPAADAPSAAPDASSSAPNAPPAPAAPTARPVELARVGTLDPAPRGDFVIPVTVTRDGAINAFGKNDLGLTDLRREFVAATNRKEWREPDGASKCILLVKADAALPWVVSHWIMQVAADHTIGIYKVCFAAHPRDAEEVGVLTLALPRARGSQATRQFVDELPVIGVKMSQGEGPAADPDAVGLVIESLWKEMGRNPDIKVHVKLPFSDGVGVPTGRVLQTLDVAGRMGLYDVVFRSPAPPVPDVVESADRLREYVGKLASGNGTTRFRIHGQDVGAWPTDRPRPAVSGIRPVDRTTIDTAYGLSLEYGFAATLEYLDEEAQAPDHSVPAGQSDAARPPPTKPPPINAATHKAATDLFAPIRKLTGDMEARFGTAMQAKRSGDDAGYRAALEEAVALCYEVQDRWNEVIAMMPANESFDEEETAMHHFPIDAAVVDRAITALKNMERRLRN